MTIEVFSNTDASVAASSAADAKPDTSPAPEAEKAPEQKESTEPGTEETEEDDKDESGDADPEKENGEKDDSKKEKPHKKGGFQRRIDKLNARNTAAQQELEYWKAMALKEKNAGDSKVEKVDSKPAADGKPVPESFDTHAEYVEALTDWKTEQKLNERDQKLEKSKLELAHGEILKSHYEREKSFAEKTADYAEVMDEAERLAGASPTLVELIVSSDNGPELMYELAKNKADYERINKLPPLAAARELGKIEAKLAVASEAKKQEPKKQTKAPRPIEPVGKGGGVVVEKSLDDPSLTQAEFEAIRRKQLAARKSAW